MWNTFNKIPMRISRHIKTNSNSSIPCYIQFWNSITLKTINYARADSLGLKYQRSTPSGCRDLGIRKLEFVAGTQLLQNFCHNLWILNRCRRLFTFQNINSINSNCLKFEISKVYTIQVAKRYEFVAKSQFFKVVFYILKKLMWLLPRLGFSYWV